MSVKITTKKIQQKLSSLKFDPAHPSFKAILDNGSADYCFLRAKEELSLAGAEAYYEQESEHYKLAIQLLVAGLLLNDEKEAE